MTGAKTTKECVPHDGGISEEKFAMCIICPNSSKDKLYRQKNLFNLAPLNLAPARYAYNLLRSLDLNRRS